MNHKRGKPKNARAGCLMCKPWKINKVNFDARWKIRDIRQIERGKWEIKEYA